MKTVVVNALVHEVLDFLPKPYSMHVIEDAFCAIETNSEWLRTLLFGSVVLAVVK